MTSISILKQVEDVQEIITSSRNDITGGKQVDLSAIAHKITTLFNTVSEQPHTSLEVNVSEIASSLGTLMNELDELETDLTQQQEVLSAPSKAATISATTAYQS